MFDYIHITQGRLRVRISSLKANAVGGRRLYIALRRIRGVRAVEINLLTGSVLILHDGARATSDAVALELGGFAKSALASAMTRATGPSTSRNVAAFVVSKLADVAWDQLVASVTMLL